MGARTSTHPGQSSWGSALAWGWGSAAGAAGAIANGADPASIAGVGKFAGGAKGVEVNAILLAPNPITKDNLNVVLDAGWIDQATLCKDVPAGTVAVCG